MATEEAAVRTGVTKRQLGWFSGALLSWNLALGMQQVLVTWIYVGILNAPAASFGVIQMLLGLPGLVFMLIGGATADRSEGRALLLRMHLFAAFPPVYLVAVTWLGLLDYWTLGLYAIALRVLGGFVQPARDAMLSVVARGNIQRGVTLMTALQSLSSITGTWLAGQVDAVGIAPIILLQGLIFLGGAAFVQRLDRFERAQAGDGRARPWQEIAEGLAETWRLHTVRHTVAINFFSYVFNVGMWIVGFPLITIEIYGGDAALFAYMSMTWMAGNVSSNIVLYRLMPLAHPGRAFIVVMALRSLFFVTVPFGPPFWLFVPLVFLWGMSVGSHMALGRVIVQEVAPDTHRARILSVYRLGVMSAMPAGALLTGYNIAFLGLLEAMWIEPLAALAVTLFVLARTSLWQFKSADLRAS